VTNEHMRRTMEFIVEQQAQMAAHLQQLEEERIRDRPRMARLEQSFLELVEFNKTVDSRLGRSESESNRLENALAAFIEKSDSRLTRLDSTSRVLETNMSALAVSQARADERLSALIDIFRQDRGKRS